jgi:hypothetical protein
MLRNKSWLCAITERWKAPSNGDLPLRIDILLRILGALYGTRLPSYWRVRPVEEGEDEYEIAMCHVTSRMEFMRESKITNLRMAIGMPARYGEDVHLRRAAQGAANPVARSPAGNSRPISPPPMMQTSRGSPVAPSNGYDRGEVIQFFDGVDAGYASDDWLDPNPYQARERTPSESSWDEDDDGYVWPEDRRSGNCESCGCVSRPDEGATLLGVRDPGDDSQYCWKCWHHYVAETGFASSGWEPIARPDGGHERAFPADTRLDRRGNLLQHDERGRPEGWEMCPVFTDNVAWGDGIAWEYYHRRTLYQYALATSTSWEVDRFANEVYGGRWVYNDVAYRRRVQTRPFPTSYPPYPAFSSHPGGRAPAHVQWDWSYGSGRYKWKPESYLATRTMSGRERSGIWHRCPRREYGQRPDMYLYNNFRLMDTAHDRDIPCRRLPKYGESIETHAARQQHLPPPDIYGAVDDPRDLHLDGSRAGEAQGPIPSPRSSPPASPPSPSYSPTSPPASPRPTE